MLGWAQDAEHPRLIFKPRYTGSIDMRRIREIVVLAVLGTAGAAGAALAQEAEPRCEGRGENGMVSLLLCPEGLEAEDYAAEGRIACDGRKPCGAWIWLQAEAVPAEAPDAHDKLPRASVQQAVAIWVNESEKLMMLERQAGD